MNRVEFSRNIAKSLTLGAWSENVLLTNLKRRLPERFHEFAPQIIDDLLNGKPASYAPSTLSVASRLRRIASFERIYRVCEKHQIWPDPDLTPSSFAPIAIFSHLDVPSLTTLEELADWLFLSKSQLEYLADMHHRCEEKDPTWINHYHYSLTIKKSGGHRLIEAPKARLKSVQRHILRHILEKVPNHPNTFGFIKGRSCLQAASRHANEDVVICFDLKNFFPSIGQGRVFGLFRCLGYPHSIAKCLTALCTTATPRRMLEQLTFDEQIFYRGSHLPQGAPSSPALANHIAFRLDCRLSVLAERLDAQYSRYADDLAFSGDKRIVSAILAAVPNIAHDEGFIIHAAKTRVMGNAGQKIVTGLLVNEHLNIDRGTFDHLKAIIHACGKKGDERLADPAFRNSLLGRIEWVQTVNPRRGEKLRQMLEMAYFNKYR